VSGHVFRPPVGISQSPGAAIGLMHLLDRQTLEYLGQSGHRGATWRQFPWVHRLAVDSKGSIYTTALGISGGCRSPW
jgi:hypothetical protein